MWTDDTYPSTFGRSYSRGQRSLYLAEGKENNHKGVTLGVSIGLQAPHIPPCMCHWLILNPLAISSGERDSEIAVPPGETQGKWV